MAGERLVIDIDAGRPDSTGAEIVTVYSKVTGTFAVYRTAERVMVQYADDPMLGGEQRLQLNPLNPLRGEINGLVDGWRKGAPEDRQRAEMFDRRTADALVTALQGDQTHAEELLKAVKADVLEERLSIGRIAYLRWATWSAIFVVLLFAAIVALAGLLPASGTGGSSLSGALVKPVTFVVDHDVWLAAGMGALGALFSIALGIRAREIRTDLENRDNIADAILRISIGAVSAVILFSLIKSGFITIAGIQLRADSGNTDATFTHMAIVVAFLAGFSERLVGDFLTRAGESVAGSSPTGSGKAGTEEPDDEKPEVEPNEQNPRGLAAFAGHRPITASLHMRDMGDDEDAHPHDEEDIDGCLCDAPEGVVGDVTEDEDLPPARGGVAA